MNNDDILVLIYKRITKGHILARSWWRWFYGKEVCDIVTKGLGK
jgi:hypothetical protein